MEPIWKAHWPSGLDEATIRLPEEPLPVILKANARRTPDKAALVFYGREVSFGELDEASDRVAGWVPAPGPPPRGPGPPVLPDRPPARAIASRGARRPGAIAVGRTPMHRAWELGHELEDSGARVLVGSDQG